MIIALKKIKIKDKIYFLDTRLKELRNVNDIDDRIELDDFDIYYFEKIYNGEVIKKEYGWLINEE